MLVEFSLKLLYSTMCGKNFQIYGVHTVLENALIRGIFTHAPPHSKLTPKFLSSHSRQQEITHSSRHHSFENLYLPAAERVEETIICFIKIQSEIMKMTWNIRFFIFYLICNSFKYDGFTIL